MALRRFILKTYSLAVIYLEGGSKKATCTSRHVSLVIQTTVVNYAVFFDYLAKGNQKKCLLGTCLDYLVKGNQEKPFCLSLELALTI